MSFLMLDPFVFVLDDFVLKGRTSFGRIGCNSLKDIVRRFLGLWWL